MERLNTTERDAIAAATAYPMLPLVEQWSAINSGTRNLAGLATMADRLADAFGRLPGTPILVGSRSCGVLAW